MGGAAPPPATPRPARGLRGTAGPSPAPTQAAAPAPPPAAAPGEGSRCRIRGGQILTDLHPREPNCFSLHPVNHTCQQNNPATPLHAAQVCDGFGNKTQVSQVLGQHIHHLLGMAHKSHTKPFFTAACCKNSSQLTLMSLFSPSPAAAALKTPCSTCDITSIAMETDHLRSYTRGLLELQISVKQKVHTTLLCAHRGWTCLTGNMSRGPRRVLLNRKRLF